jgi:hypothetical protein
MIITVTLASSGVSILPLQQASGSRHRASRGGRAPEKFIAAAYGAGRLRSRKQKDADHQPCCECPQA